MARRRSPHDSPLMYRRRNRAAYPNSLPGSRSSSPGRNVKMKRAMFENNSFDQTGNKQDLGNNEFEEITIEGVEEFNRVYDSARKINSPASASQSPHVSPVKKSTESSGGRQEFQTTNVFNATKNAKNNSVVSVIDRTNARIIPDYVAAVPKPLNEPNRIVETIANENVERRRIVKRRGGEGNRAQRRYQTLQDSTQIQAAKQRYQPNYIQPVVSSTSAKKYGVADSDVYSQAKRDTLHNNERNISTTNEQKTRPQVQHLKSWELRTRLPSSGDSSSSEMPTSVEHQTTNYIEVKQSNKFESGKKPAARTGRRLHRQRFHNSQQTPSTETDQPMLTSPSKQQAAVHIHSLNTGMDTTHSSWSHQQSGVHQELPSSQTSHSGRRERVRRRPKPPFVAETEEKYSTIPADFRPGEMTNILISGDRQDTSLQAATSDSNCNRARSSNQNELMITNEQTLVSLENAKKESSDVNGDTANHSVHNQHLQTNHSSDKTRFATSHKDSTEKSFVAIAAGRTKQVDNLRNIFSSAEQQGKIEFGRAYQKAKQKFVNQESSGNEVIKAKDDHVSHSQPMLTVTKISEDYWPRDEATQRLLMRNHSNNSDMHKNVDSSSVKLNEKSRMTERITVNQADVSHESLNTSEPLQSPKETNLSDPIDFNDCDFKLYNSSNCKSHKPNEVSLQNDHQSVKVGANQSEKLTPAKWSFDDPDSKLEAFEFDSNYNSSGGDISKTHSSLNSRDFGSKDSNTLINSSSSIDSHLQSNSSLFSPVATSERKNSIVSNSKPLPRAYIASTENKNSVESLDEGCCVDDGSTTELSNFGSAASFSAYANLDRGENRMNPLGKRRRKGSAANGHHGSDSSNNSGESNRSLSDPTANRKKSPNSAEEETGAIDSNFQYPLKSKDNKESHHPEKSSSRSDESECSDTGSMQSDSTDKIQNDNLEPHIIEEMLEQKGLKTIKKKSRSDPDSKAVLTASLMNKGDLEMTSLLSSNSDPNLADKLDAKTLGRRHPHSRSSVTSDRRSHESSVTHIADITQSIEQLSHSLAYEQDLGGSKTFHPQEKNLREQANIQSDSESFFKPIREGKADFIRTKDEPHPVDNPLEQEEEMFNKICEMMTKPEVKSAKESVAHVRSCSEPVGTETLDTNLARKLYERGRRPGIVQAPSLSDVLHGDSNSPKPLSNSMERMPSATLPRTTTPRGLDYHTFHKARSTLVSCLIL